MPGLRSYLASMMGLFVLAAVLGEVKSGKTGLCDGLRAALEAYNGRFARRAGADGRQRLRRRRRHERQQGL